MKKSTKKNFSLIGFLLVGITIAAGLWAPGVGVGNAAASEARRMAELRNSPTNRFLHGRIRRHADCLAY